MYSMTTSNLGNNTYVQYIIIILKDDHMICYVYVCIYVLHDIGEQTTDIVLSNMDIHDTIRQSPFHSRVRSGYSHLSSASCIPRQP